MKKQSDESKEKIILEQLFESGTEKQFSASNLSELDLANYKKLFSALATPPEEGLSMDFSTKLRNKIHLQLQRKDKIKFYTSWALVFIITIPLLLLGLFILDKAYNTQIIPIILQHKWIFITAFPLLFIIQYLDYSTIKNQQINKTLLENKFVK